MNGGEGRAAARGEGAPAPATEQNSRRAEGVQRKKKGGEKVPRTDLEILESSRVSEKTKNSH
jgi:hypothetical protein